VSAARARSKKSPVSGKAPTDVPTAKRERGGLTPPYLFAFLRAVNLGKHNKVPMKRLMELLAERDFPPTAYLLASGNIVFGPSEGGHDRLAADLEHLIADEFGVDTAVIYRTPEQLQEDVDANPFSVPQGGSVHLALWNSGENVPDEKRAELAGIDAGEDSLKLIGDAAYLRFAVTSHTSKLSNQLLQRRLGVRSTARNLNTMLRLLVR